MLSQLTTLCWIAVVLPASVGAQKPSRAATPTHVSAARALVPAVPPDSVPADYGDTARWVSSGSHGSSRILPDIVVLEFRRYTPQADRQAAVDLVHGIVVGGRRRGDGDGIYLVRVPTDGTIEPLFQAIATLEALPQVSFAMPEMLLIGAPI